MYTELKTFLCDHITLIKPAQRGLQSTVLWIGLPDDAPAGANAKLYQLRGTDWEFRCKLNDNIAQARVDIIVTTEEAVLKLEGNTNVEALTQKKPLEAEWKAYTWSATCPPYVQVVDGGAIEIYTRKTKGTDAVRGAAAAAGGGSAVAGASGKSKGLKQGLGHAEQNGQVAKRQRTDDGPAPAGSIEGTEKQVAAGKNSTAPPTFVWLGPEESEQLHAHGPKAELISKVTVHFTGAIIEKDGSRGQEVHYANLDNVMLGYHPDMPKGLALALVGRQAITNFQVKVPASMVFDGKGKKRDGVADIPPNTDMVYQGALISVESKTTPVCDLIEMGS